MTNSIFKFFLLLAPVLLLSACQTRKTAVTADFSDLQSAPVFAAKLSTNWIATARSVLPAKVLAAKELNFSGLTNALCQEGLHGNNAAKGMWGYTVLLLSKSEVTTASGLRLMREAAGAGDVPTMTRLGFIYEDGIYVRKNFNPAFHWFSRAADAGNPGAQLQLGGCYQYGLGTTPNPTLAAQYYRLSADQGNYIAMRSLGYLLLNGLGVNKDLAAAKYWFTRAVEEGGNRRAMFHLGTLALMNFPDTNATAQAFQWYKKSAELGDDLACLQLANFYYRGWGGVETNLTSYRYWRLKAATLGATAAQYNMGAAYRTGDGVPVDIETALVWYRKAAAKNDPRAFYDLALYYQSAQTNHESAVLANKYLQLAAQGGHRAAQFQYALSFFSGGTAPVDFEKGKQWLAASAEAGWADAEFYLFQLYYNGVAPSLQCPAYAHDKVGAIEWLRRAAAHGNLPAQSILANMLLHGQDVAVDKVAAEPLLRAAAEHGDTAAQADLGLAIANGDTPARDPEESAMWLQLGCVGSTDAESLNRAKAVLANLTAAQQSQVDQRVKKFQALPVPPQDPMAAGWEANTAYQPEDSKFSR